MKIRLEKLKTLKTKFRAIKKSIILEKYLFLIQNYKLEIKTVFY